MNLQLMRLRKDAGYSSRKEFAKAIGVSEAKLKSWETGARRFPLADACRIADVFAVSLDELAGRWEYVTSTPARDPDERRLVDAYRSTDARGKGAIMRTAEGEAGVEGQSETGVNERSA